MNTKVRLRPWMLWLIVAPSLVVVAANGASTLTNVHSGGGNQVIVVTVALAVVAIHLRHAFAAIGGRRPAGWPWTFTALAGLAFVPQIWWDGNWSGVGCFAAASTAMLLRDRPRIWVPVVAAMAVAAVAVDLVTREIPLPVLYLIWGTVGFTVGVGYLYGPVELVRVLAQLRAARADLAEAAVVEERLRVSRDLHDLLGQSLSAVSIKGDLAGELLERDPRAARDELHELADVARGALHSLRSVTRGARAISLQSEVDGAVQLLSAAGISPSIEIAARPRTAEADQLLGWAVREGITNVLRHSSAHVCGVRTYRAGGSIRLEIVNDGARSPAGEDHDGTGLSGLAERAAALSATVTHSLTEGRFRLLIEVPEEAR